jgi:hypothetical protein
LKSDILTGIFLDLDAFIHQFTGYNTWQMLIRNNLLLLLAILLLPMLTLADEGPFERTLEWKAVSKVKITDTRIIYELGFKGARYHSRTADLPVFMERFATGNPNIEVEAILSNQVWESIPESSIRQVKGYEMIADGLEINTGVALEKKQAFAVVSFVPLRKNSMTGSYEKLVSFTLRLRYIEKAVLQRGGHTWAQSSVLASGNWYKLGVQFSGVHKIDYEELSSLGMNTSDIDPRNLRIYGNGGGMLPEPTDDPMIDDLMENAIFVAGESDGSFDPGDYILFFGESPHTWTWDEETQQFIHQLNIYSDFSYYFITADLGPGKRIQTISSTREKNTPKTVAKIMAPYPVAPLEDK